MSIKVYGFKTEYRRKDGKDEAVDWVSIGPIGLVMASTTWYRIEDIKPKPRARGDNDGQVLMLQKKRWEAIEPSYIAWKQGQELPETGTPLAAWAGVPSEIASAMQRAGIRTVEDVAGLTSTDLSRVPIPNIAAYIKSAKSYLEAMPKADQDAKIEALQEQLAAAMELLEERTSDKPKRGRPVTTEIQEINEAA